MTSLGFSERPASAGQVIIPAAPWRAGRNASRNDGFYVCRPNLYPGFDACPAGSPPPKRPREVGSSGGHRSPIHGFLLRLTKTD